MAFAFRAMHSFAAAAPLRASAARRVSARVPAARVAVRAMADDAPEGPPVHELIDVRVGKVLKASKHEDSDKLYVEEIDLGEAEPRTICSGLAPYMAAEDIEGKLVVVLANLKSRKMAGVPSHGMVLCASDSSHEKVELLIAPEGAAPGERVKFGAWDAEQSDAHTENQMKKKKTWEKVVDDLCTTDGCVAAYKDLEMVTSAGPVTCASITGGTVG